MTVETADDARSKAREALEVAGYDDVSLTDEPHQQTATWVVPAEADGERLNVHVSENGESEIAEIDG
ncbi:hypothetical protein [Natronorarus salvus]|uniref:hypothetical protein n=1 Tax=Natronorarus salvus TaxID=3117733 RepID=UPI002F263CDB